MSADRVETLVVQRARAQQLVSDAQLAAARAAHASAVASGRASNLLVHLADELDPETRAAVRQIYLDAVEAARAQFEGGVATVILDSQPTAPLEPVAETVADTSSSAERAPLEIPGYTVRGELGRGGMGVVYRATSSEGHEVAIKVLLAGDGATTEDLARFRTEAEAVERLEHEHVVTLLEHGQVDGSPYMVLEFVDGEDLEARLTRDERLPPEEAVDIAIELADALSCAHEQGILHRDLKPQNVLLDREGLPKLTDFGLAKLRSDDASSFSLTQSGTLLGTPAYMAPEQADGDRRRIDERTDVYGLGATLYHMLTGSRPFSAPTLPSLFVKILNAPPPSPRSLVPDLDPDLETIVLKCLEKDGADRYPSAQQLMLDLSRWRKNLSILAAPPSLVVRARRAARRNPALPFAAGFGVLVLLLALIGLRSLQTQAELEAKLASLQTPPPADSAEQDPAPAEPPREPELPAEPSREPESPADPAPEPGPSADPVPEPEPSADPEPEPEPLADPVSEPEPPAPDPEPREAPAASLEGAERPPDWIVGRARRYATSRAALPYADGWIEGATEAYALNVPLIVVALGPEAEDLPAGFAELAQRSVLVVAQMTHPNAGKLTAPCARHPGMTCGQHLGTCLPIAKDLGPLGGSASKLMIYRITKRPVPFAGFAELIGIGGGVKSDFRLIPEEAAAITRRAQSFMGEPTVPVDVLTKLQPHFYALSELAAAGEAPSKPLVEGGKRAGPALMEHLRDPEPVGAWARWCVRELVSVALQKAKEDGRLLRIRHTSRNLMQVFGADPVCARRIQAFAEEFGGGRPVRAPRWKK